MACCLTAPSHYLKQAWAIGILYRLYKRLPSSGECQNFFSFPACSLKNYLPKIKSPRGQWVNSTTVTVQHINVTCPINDPVNGHLYEAQTWNPFSSNFSLTGLAVEFVVIFQYIQLHGIIKWIEKLYFNNCKGHSRTHGCMKHYTAVWKLNTALLRLSYRDMTRYPYLVSSWRM